MPFGKHRNTPLRDVPGKYLTWLGRQPWIHEHAALRDYLVSTHHMLPGAQLEMETTK